MEIESSGLVVLVSGDRSIPSGNIRKIIFVDAEDEFIDNVNGKFSQLTNDDVEIVFAKRDELSQLIPVGEDVTVVLCSPATSLLEDDDSLSEFSKSFPLLVEDSGRIPNEVMRDMISSMELFLRDSRGDDILLVANPSSTCPIQTGIGLFDCSDNLELPYRKKAEDAQSRSKPPGSHRRFPVPKSHRKGPPRRRRKGK